MAHPIRILTLKVTLSGIHPPIWRRLEVSAGYTLAQLHRVLQAAMGWTGTHLHQFLAGDHRYGPRDPEMADEQRDEEATHGWEHDIVLEGVSMPEVGVGYPVCVGGERACPPEDCGGIPGYSDFLEAVRDPSHPEHANLMEWVGGEFDPESFSVEGVNRLLRSGFRKAPR